MATKEELKEIECEMCGTITDEYEQGDGKTCNRCAKEFDAQFNKH
jgi:hypothetical protein